MQILELHHCLKYSTKKNVSKISMLFVVWSRTRTEHCVNNWQATLSRCFSECVNLEMLDERTAVNPRSSTKISIYSREKYSLR
jgi:hypothetical protein